MTRIKKEIGLKNILFIIIAILLAAMLIIKIMEKDLISIAILAINLQENFEIATLGYSMVLYSLTMKCFNVVARQVQDV